MKKHKIHDVALCDFLSDFINNVQLNGSTDGDVVCNTLVTNTPSRKIQMMSKQQEL